MNGDESVLHNDNLATLALARKLVSALEADDKNAALQHLRMLGAESALYRWVGEVAREVHDRIHEFLSDSGLARLAHSETPDTRRRLEHVIDLTADAAHRTLTAVERARPYTDAIMAHPLNGTDGEAVGLIAASHRHAEAIRAELSQIVMAQEFQDLSGQILRRAIALVTDIEARLIELLQLAGMPEETAADASVPGTAHGEGPRVAGTGNENNLADQDEVDELLKSLGF